MWKYIENLFKIATLIVLISFLPACTGSGHYLAKISDSDLLKVENEIQTKTFKATKYKRSDAQNRALISRVFKKIHKKAQPLCDHTGYTSCYFQTVYNPGKTVNAYASENNKITMFRGLLEYLKNDDEVAFVIAHEMGHHLANHNQEKMRNAQVGGAISGILTAVILSAGNQNGYNAYQQQQYQKTVTDMMNVGAALGALSYSKAEEREADLLGQYLLVRSGYSLKRAERVVWLLLDIETTGGGTESRSAFGESHPAGPERIAAWRNTIQEIQNNPSKLPYKVNERPGQPKKSKMSLKKVKTMPYPARKP